LYQERLRSRCMDSERRANMSAIRPYSVCCYTACSTKSTENQQPTKNKNENGTTGYLDLVSDEDYKVAQSATKSNPAGYLSPVNVSPGPEHSYVVLVPSPTTPEHNGDVEQKVAGAGGGDPRASSPATNAGYLTPFDDGAVPRVDDERYLDMSVTRDAPQPRDDSSNTESTREYSNQLPDDGYVAPAV